MKKALIILLGAIVLLLTQCSSTLWNGQIIYNSELLETKPVLINLDKMTKQVVVLPVAYQNTVVETSGTLDLFRPTFDKFTWSNSGEELAFPCMLKNNVNLTVCIWESKFLTLENKTLSQNPISYPLNPTEVNIYPESLIRNISWSPDDEILIVTARWDDIESPCLVDKSSKKVECGIKRSFWKGFSDSALLVLAGAFIVEWSPTDINQMAIPLRKNWLGVFEDGYTVVGGEKQEYVTGASTGNYSDGIYLIDLQNKSFQSVWIATSDERIDSHNKILWSPSGEDLAFVYAEDVNFSSSTHTANYVVATVNPNGKNFDVLFDSKELMMKMKQDLPEDVMLPSIFLADWSSDNRYLLFEVNFKEEKTRYSFIGALVYDIKTDTFISIIEFKKTESDWFRLSPNWSD